MPELSLIYRNIFWYRLIMSILYLGGYKKRYKLLFQNIKTDKSVLELCFGDILLAEFCKKHNISWTGLDINSGFVNRAKGKGFNATQCDIAETDFFPKADICFMSGSLYHFADNADDIFRKMLEASERIIISEPVKNISESKGLLGYIAKRSANSGKKHEIFRFNEILLMKLLEKEKSNFGFNYRVIERYKKDLIIEITK